MPEDLTRFWLGHAGTSITDIYANGLREDLAWRQECAERVGTGFNLVGLFGVTNVVRMNAPRVA